MKTETLIAVTNNMIAEAGHHLDAAMFDARQGNLKQVILAFEAARNRLNKSIEILDNLSKPD